MPIFPLTPQQFSNLKKELKANKKKPGKVLEEIIANPKNSQQLNVIQLALFCLDLNGDLNLAQKLTNSFISAALYPQAFSILLLQHSLLHSKDQKITSPKTPSKTEIAKLLHVDPKTFTRLPNYICIYLINVMRVTVALEIDIEINAFFSKKDGLIYWLDRLEKSDKQLIQDHAFRMLYNILNEFLKKSNDRLKSGKIHWVFTDAVEYAKIVLTLYKDSSKFQQENFDKLAGNYVGYFSKLESPIQRGFFKYLLTLQMDSKSNNCNIWFEHIMNLEIEVLLFNTRLTKTC